MNDCCKKHKLREKEEKALLMNRLKRIEGQVRGIQKMVDEDAYCTDILTQVSAITAALNGFNRELLDSHIRTCVVDGIKADDSEVVDDLVRSIHKLMK